MSRYLCLSLVLTLVVGMSNLCPVSASQAAADKKSKTQQKSPKTGKIKTLFLTGGKVHNAKDIGDITQAALEKTGKFDVTRVHEDLDALLADRIAPFDLVIFYWTLGGINESQKRGLMNHIAAGKGYATFHSGADSFRGDPDYRALVGGHFITHPHYRTYQVSVTENDSPITEGIDEFMITDEQYILDFDSNLNVLANALHKGKPCPCSGPRAGAKVASSTPHWDTIQPP